MSPFLFRGQSDATWGLTTTLERYLPCRVRIDDYYTGIWRAKSQIETFTGLQWDVPPPSEISKRLETKTSPPYGILPGYEYLVYLRHHSFPSPLLDWSQSPYVVAFFAFNQATPQTKRVAIYVYWEDVGYGKGISPSLPHIQTLTTNVRSHRRHFVQQSQYTVCSALDAGEWYFARHEEALSSGVLQQVRTGEQDLLWKFTIPAVEWRKVLRMLNRYSLNAFSLFGSDESLMESIAMYAFILQDDDL